MNAVLKILLYAAVTVVPYMAMPQQAPDNDLILANTMDSSSPYYYPSLMERYKAGDTTLTEEDYRYLYYGFAFTPDYHPLASIPSESMTLMALERADAMPNEENMRDVIRCATETMASDPFSPSNLNFLTYAYGALGDTINERINYDRLNKVLAAIRSSGTGLTEKSPMHVIRLSHAADVLGTLGLSVTKRLVVSRTTEYISVANEEGRRLSKGYYFDYSRIFWGDPEDLPQKPRRWKINEYQLE